MKVRMSRVAFVLSKPQIWVRFDRLLHSLMHLRTVVDQVEEPPAVGGVSTLDEP